MILIVLILGLVFILEGLLLVFFRQRVAKNLPEASKGRRYSFPGHGSPRSIAALGSMIVLAGIVLVLLYSFDILKI